MSTRIRDTLVVPLLAIGLALIVGAVIMVLSSPLIDGSFDVRIPFQAYAALIKGSLGTPEQWVDGNFNAIVQTLVETAPLLLAGLAVGLGFKGGLFNIGAQGQFLLAGLAAAFVGGLLASSSPFVAVPAALLAGLLVGAAWGFIPGALKAFTGAHEVVTTIMLNYIAVFIIAYLITGPLRDPTASFARTISVGNASLPVLFGRNGHLGILIAALAVPAVWWLLYRSTLGFEIRAVGANPDAARYAGMHPKFLLILTMSLSGLLAGLAGGVQILGLTGYMPIGYSTSLGFDAIAVALLGRAHPVGILLAALLFGAMRAGAGQMQVDAHIPVQMIDLLQGIILFFLAAEVVLRKWFRIRSTGVGGVPAETTVTRSYGGQTSI